ncbi:MAG: hypothetical protein ACLVAU_08240 [Ruminococcus sp.]
MRFGGYEIGDKIIYTNSFTKPTLGKVVYYINDNYLIDLSNNTRQWVTDRELSKYTKKEDYLKLFNKYLKGKKCRCTKDYTFKDSPYAPECFKETIPANTEFTIHTLFFPFRAYTYKSSGDDKLCCFTCRYLATTF